MQTDLLADLRILVVDDEYILARGLEKLLGRAGATVIGPAPSVERACALVRTSDRIDVAVLDLNLRGEPAYPVAEALDERGIPFVFLTGYEGGVIDAAFAHVPRYQKPVAFEPLFEALRDLARS